MHSGKAEGNTERSWDRTPAEEIILIKASKSIIYLDTATYSVILQMGGCTLWIFVYTKAINVLWVESWTKTQTQWRWKFPANSYEVKMGDEGWWMSSQASLSGSSRGGTIFEICPNTLGTLQSLQNLINRSPKCKMFKKHWEEIKCL